MRRLWLIAIFGTLIPGRYLIASDGIGTFGTVTQDGRLDVGTLGTQVWIYRLDQPLRIAYPLRIETAGRL